MMHTTSCMLNLTYDDANLPDHGQLYKDHLQRFFKRMRKAGYKFRYVASGEYGEKTRRPHFHIALFGVDFSADRVLFGSAVGGDRTYISKSVTRLWTKGNHLIGTLNFESAAYIARYIMKKLKGPNASPMPLHVDADSGEVVLPNPEFLLMSKGRGPGQGIGGSWFREFFMSDVFPTGSIVTAQGSVAPVPRYYKTLLKEVGHDLSLDMQFRQSARAEMDAERNMYENQPIRKIARQKVVDSRINQSKRFL
ncbi:replication associated protein [Microviridae sp.]|nr:replication associated protein [Microviridae sp.]UOF79026.1 replication associated protein [Microviridae sp.]